MKAARKTFRAAVEALVEADRELAVDEKTSKWLGAWPNGKFGGGRRIVVDLPSLPNGDSVGVDEALDALYKRGLPPEPVRPKGALRSTSEGASPCVQSR